MFVPFKNLQNCNENYKEKKALASNVNAIAMFGCILFRRRNVPAALCPGDESSLAFW